MGKYGVSVTPATFLELPFSLEAQINYRLKVTYFMCRELV